jgi:hypothetical protein
MGKGGGSVVCPGDPSVTSGDVSNAIKDFWDGNVKSDFSAVIEGLFDADAAVAQAAAVNGWRAIAASVDPLEATGDFADFLGGSGDPVRAAAGAELTAVLGECAGFSAFVGLPAKEVSLRFVDEDDDGVWDLEEALQEAGAYAVRENQDPNAFAVTGRVSDLLKLWGIEPQTCAGIGLPTCQWEDFLPGARLLFGSPAPRGNSQEQGFPGVGSHLFNIYPATTLISQALVGTCAVDGVATGLTRLERDASILELSARDPTFCDDPAYLRPNGAAASIFEGLTQFAQRLLTPTPLRASASLNPGGAGGLLTNFSRFDVSSITGSAVLEFVQCPNGAGTAADCPLADDWEPWDPPDLDEGADFTVYVQARTDLGTPFEFLALEISSQANSGDPACDGAGACLQGETGPFPTAELTGVAEFAGARFCKTGGYELVASLSGTDENPPLIVEDGISAKFNVKPNGGCP